MEKGEVAILAGQFAALAVTVLLLSNFVGASAISTPSIVSVDWGGPSSHYGLTKNSLNQEKVNESTISVFYTLAPTTVPSSASASRLCLGENGTGEVFTYAKVLFLTDNSTGKSYLSFGPVGQPFGETCTYTILLTDSLEQTVTWVGSVQEVAATSS